MTEPRWLTCEEAVRLLAAYLDQELQHEDHQHVERHLQHCRSCYSRAEFEKHLKQQLGQLGREPVRPEFEGRIRSLIARFEAPKPGAGTER